MTTVLSPHTDDAVLSCWSILSREPGAAVINVFAGTPDGATDPTPWDRLTGARKAPQRMLERVREDAEALGRLGLRPVNLDFLQNGYRRGEQDAGRLLERIAPHLTSGTVYAPAGVGGHPDHLAVRAAAAALLRKGVPVVLYAELPYCVLYGWPHWVAGTEPDPHLDVTQDWQRFLDHGDAAVSAEQALVEALAPDAQAEKLAAVKEYRTQYSGLRGMLGHDDWLAYEVFWPLEVVKLGALGAMCRELLWRLGVRRGSRLELLFRRGPLRRLRPAAGSPVDRFLRGLGRAR